MNQDYIRYLSEKIGAQVQNRENGTYDTRKFNLAFARMIVDICVDVVDECVDHREPASTYKNRIRAHFGMETDDD